MEIILKIKNWEDFKQWRAIRAGKKPINLERGVGYYITLGLLGAKTRGRVDRIPMQSGRTAIAELIDYRNFSDPNDMIEKSWWHVSGYEGEKPFKEMTFSEYLNSTKSHPK